MEILCDLNTVFFFLNYDLLYTLFIIISMLKMKLESRDGRLVLFYFNKNIFLMIIYFMTLYIYFQLLIGLYSYKYKIRGIEIITMT